MQYIFDYRYITRWTSNEWRGRLIQARNELEFLLISQTPSAVSLFRRGTRAKISHQNWNSAGLLDFRRENSSSVWGKKVHAAAKKFRRKSVPQLKIIKLIGPWDNQANYWYQSTIAPHRRALPMRLHPRDFFTRMTNPINYRATEPTLRN